WYSTSSVRWSPANSGYSVPRKDAYSQYNRACNRTRSCCGFACHRAGRFNVDPSLSTVPYRRESLLRRHSYLVTTPNGLILINSDLEQTVPQIKASIEHLGFKFSDVKILLISHAHFDHDAGSARIKALTGAKYMVMDADVPVVESGGKLDFQYGTSASSLYPPTTVDRVLHDGDQV